MDLFLLYFSEQRHCLYGKKLVMVVLVLGLLTACNNVNLEVEVPMSDGTKLSTDIYLPIPLRTLEKVSTLLIRTPYGKENLSYLGVFAENGYAVAIQDMRMSRKGPAEDFLFFRSDGWTNHRDGYDTLAYLRDTFWSNGKVVTYGASALGIAQYLLAGADAEGLTGQFVAFATPDLYEDFFFPGGLFRKNDTRLWLQRQGYSEQEQDSIIAREIYSHRVKDNYWNSVDLTNRLEHIKAPAFHLGGWFDIFVTGTIKGYKLYREAGVKNNYLVMGPWTHPGDEFGDTVPTERVFETNGIEYWPDDWLLQWEGNPGRVFLDQALFNDLDSFNWYPVTYYVMGSVNPLEQPAPGFWWCYADDWPPPGGVVRTYYLQNNFQLNENIPPPEELGYLFDPRFPIPTVCGRFYDPRYAGFCDVHILYDVRSDLLYFETEALQKALEVTGEIVLQLEIISDRTDTDFAVFLVDVYPDGSKMLITDGIMRARFREGFNQEVPLIPGKPHLLTIQLSPTSMIFNAGHKIGLYVGSSNYPGFEINPNTGINKETDPDSIIATNKIITGGNTFLVLPIYEEFSCNPSLQNMSIQ